MNIKIRNRGGNGIKIVCARRLRKKFWHKKNSLHVFLKSQIKIMRAKNWPSENANMTQCEHIR